MDFGLVEIPAHFFVWSGPRQGGFTFCQSLPSIRGMFETLKSLFRPAAEKSAAAALPPVVEPKVPNKVQTQPSMSKRTATSKGEQKLAAADRRTANLDLLSLRNGTSTKSTIHDLAQVSPDLSAAVTAYLRLVVTKEFTAVGYNLDGTINPDATALAQQLISRFNYLTDYTDGFSGVSSIHSLAESLAKELRLYGSCSMELVLDKARVPNRLQPISTTQIDFWEDDSGYTFPVQKINGREIPLDVPTFFYEALDQDLLVAYSDSPMEAALTATLADAEFTNDVRRVIKRALHPRLNVSIDTDKFRKSVPLDIAADPDKVRAYQEEFISNISTTVNGLEPDDALIAFDSIGFSYLNNGNSTLSDEWTTLQESINSKMATGAKAPPTVLGHSSGSQNIASTETLLFLKYCEGVQNHVNSILSRALTLATRLLGQDCYVQFKFASIDMRPESELEAFFAMKQSRVLMQLSIGLISDEEASILLTGRLPPPGAPKLSGTFFMAGATDPNAQPVDANPNSNTGATNGGPQDQRPQTPTQPKGPAKKPDQITRVK